MGHIPEEKLKIIIIACSAALLLLLAVGGGILARQHADNTQQKKQEQLEAKKAASQQIPSETDDADAISDAQEDIVSSTSPEQTAPEGDPAPKEESPKGEEPPQTEPDPTPDAQAPQAEQQPQQEQPADSGNVHVVAIDAGHQAKGNSEKEPIGPGASETKAKVASGTHGNTSGLDEYQLTLQVSMKLKDELEARGYKVIMIRETDDVNISNAERAQTANESDAEIFLRIHANGDDNSSVKGALTMAPTSGNPYVSGIAAQCQRLSQVVLDGYCAATGFQKRDILLVDNMSGINWCAIPVTILEMGFMSNPEDDANMANEEMQAKMVQGISNGVDAYFTK